MHRSLAIKRDDIFTSALLKCCIEDLVDENVLPENVCEPNIVATPNFALETPQSPPKNFDQVETPAMKLKLKYDDSNVSPSSDMADTSFDMSMDV